MSNAGHDIPKTVGSALSDDMEAYLLRFFGSHENAQQQAHLFVIEQEPVEVRAEQPTPEGMVFRASTRYRIRPKTAEELAGHAE